MDIDSNLVIDSSKGLCQLYILKIAGNNLSNSVSLL